MPRKQAVLIGAGHAHIPLLRRADAFRSRDIDLVLVSPEGFWYSGLATGVLGGRHGAGRNFLDPRTLLNGGKYLRDRLVGLDRNSGHAILEGGQSVPYDVLSLDVGSVVPALAGDNAGMLAVKPISNLEKLHDGVQARLQLGQSCQVAIVGSGVTAFEVAANLAALAACLHGEVVISIHGRSPVPLADLPPGARDILLENLSRRGVTFHFGVDVMSADSGRLRLADGRQQPYDIAVNASGLAPPPVVSSLGLRVDARGALVTDAFLRCDEGIFAAGDCIAFRGKALDPVGVHAVRQSSVLLENLLAFLEGKTMRPFRPRRRYGSIINLGDGTGLALWGQFWTHGRLALLLKDYIDLRFMGASNFSRSARS